VSILDLFGGNTDDLDRKATEALTGATDLYRNLETPEFEKIDPALIEYAGDVQSIDVNPFLVADPDKLDVERMDPRLANVFTQGNTEMAGITTDPRLRDAQLGALDALSGIADSGGMTLADEANLGKLQSSVAQADRGRREAILQNMQMRGQGGSGLELLAQLQSGQAATTDAAQGSLDIAGMAQDRALQAMIQSGQLGGQVRAQDFGEQADIAKAQDIINQFNTSNLTQGSQFNTGVVNDASRFNIANDIGAQQFDINAGMQTGQFNAGQGQQAATGNADRGVGVQTRNLDTQQGVFGQNTGIQNQAQMTNKIDIPQMQFGNTMQKTQGVAGGMQAEAGMYGEQAGRKQQAASEVFGGVMKAGAAVAAPYMAPAMAASEVGKRR
jgi:hypothetical protein